MVGSSPVATTVDVAGGTSVIWGIVVSADVNNNGIEDLPELGLPNVRVTLTGTVHRPQLTGGDGLFLFSQLPPGTYDLRESQPAAFVDGIDTMVDAYGGWTDDDHFRAISLGSGESARCDFGELGLHAHLISKQLCLATAPPTLAMLQTDDQRRPVDSVSRGQQRHSEGIV